MYAVVIEYDPQNGSYGATSLDFDDAVVGIGKTADEAVERFRNALEGHIAFLRERGQSLPQGHHAVISIDMASRIA
jgi:predicted RNase H-like HicB family nuclease